MPLLGFSNGGNKNNNKKRKNMQNSGLRLSDTVCTAPLRPILNSKVSQNTEKQKLGLLVTCENWRCLKNLCRFWRFEVPDDSGVDEVEEDDDAGAEDDEGEEGKAWSWPPGGGEERDRFVIFAVKGELSISDLRLEDCSLACERTGCSNGSNYAGKAAGCCSLNADISEGRIGTLFQVGESLQK